MQNKINKFIELNRPKLDYKYHTVQEWVRYAEISNSPIPLEDVTPPSIFPLLMGQISTVMVEVESFKSMDTSLFFSNLVTPEGKKQITDLYNFIWMKQPVGYLFQGQACSSYFSDICEESQNKILNQRILTVFIKKDYLR